MPILSPTVAQVGAIMRARTRDSSGVELGTFTADTRPTAAEVTSMIATAVIMIQTRLGVVPIDLDPMATQIVALRTAMYIEAAYFPEEIVNEQSAYARYKEQYEDALRDYATAVEADRGSDISKRIGSLKIGTFYTSM